MTTLAQKEKAVRSIVPNRDKLLTQADLINFQEDMLNEFKRIIGQCFGQPGKKWLKSSEVKKLLGISHGFLQTLRDSGTLPFTKLGGSIYYDYEDITSMMESKKVKKDELYIMSNA